MLGSQSRDCRRLMGLATDAVIKPQGSQCRRGNLISYYLQEAGYFLCGNKVFPLYKF